MIEWLFNDEVVTEVPIGFVGYVYLITNTTNNRKYIGRKYFESIRRIKVRKKVSTKPTKVKPEWRKNKKIVRSETNWKEYTSLCVELNSDIDKIGIHNFKFEILHFGKTKGEVNYYEENYQHKFDVLTKMLDSNTYEYYNTAIGSGKHTKTKFTPIDESLINNKLIK